MKKASMIVIAVALCAVAAAVLLWPRGNSQTEQNPVSSAQSTEENSHAPGGETQGGEDTPGGQETSEGELPLVTAPSPVQDAPAQGEAGGGQENEPAPVTGSAAPASTPAPAPGAGGSATESGVIELPFVPVE